MKYGDKTWCQTYTGIHFDIFNPRVEDISLMDIAHSLATKCRFNGHPRVFYSVAEHCVRMSLHSLPGPAVWRLMHDAAEAYIPDFPRPIKYKLCPQIDDIELRLLEIISERFNLPDYNKSRPEIELADTIMCATEARDLMGDPDWDLDVDPLPKKIEPWRWETAKNFFLQRARALGINYV